MGHKNGRAGNDGLPADGGLDFDQLRQTLEHLSLTGMEARCMVALLRLGTGTAVQVSQLSGISRSNLYPVLDSLAGRGLCKRAPGRYAIWIAAETNQVLAMLQSAEEARVDAIRRSVLHHLGKAQDFLAKLPETKRHEAPITVVDDARLGVLYVDAMASVNTEIMVLNRGPYAGEPGPDPAVLEAVARGVKARAMYVAPELADKAGWVRNTADAFAHAGVDQRVLDSLPVSMALVGPDLVLLALPSADGSSVLPSQGAAIRHRGMFELQAAAFERLWEQGQPYTVTVSNLEGTRS